MNTEISNSDLLKHFVANIIDVYDDNTLTKFCNNNNVNLKHILSHTVVKLNVLYCKIWKFLFNTYPPKKCFQDFLISVIPLEKLYIASIDTFDDTVLNTILSSEYFIIVLQLNLIQININDVQKVYKNVVSKLNDIEYIKNHIIDKWAFRYQNNKNNINYNSITLKTLLQCFIKMFISSLHLTKEECQTLYQHFTMYKPNALLITSNDLQYMNNKELFQYNMHKNNRFLRQLTTFYSILCNDLCVKDYIINTVYSINKNVIFLNLYNTYNNLININYNRRFSYNIPIDMYNFIPCISSQFLVISKDEFTYIPICKNIKECMYFSISNNIPSENTCLNYNKILTCNYDLCDPKKSIYFLPYNDDNDDKDNILLGLEIKKYIWNQYLITKCPFKTKIISDNSLLFTSFIASYLYTRSQEIFKTIDNYDYNINNTDNSISNVILIVDTRFNIMTFLASIISLYNAIKGSYKSNHKWCVQIHTSLSAIPHYKELINKFSEKINIISNLIEVQANTLLDCTVFNIDIYNSYMKNSNLWKALDDKGYTYCMVIQDDGILVNGEQLIEQFIGYDYIGAPWKDVEENKYIKDNINNEMVGNGGFCIRNIKIMNKICDTYIDEKYHLFYHNINEIPEDVYFVMCTKKLNGNIAPFNIARKFAVEQVFHYKPAGFHKLWMYHNTEDTLKIFNNLM
jgi:hypothetical protein